MVAILTHCLNGMGFSKLVFVIFTGLGSVAMMRLLAFLSRLVVYGLITTVGFAVIPTEDMLVDRNLRLSISAVQVCILTCAWLIHFIVKQILIVIKQTSPVRFARLDKHTTCEDVECVENSQHAMSELEQQVDEAQSVGTVAARSVKSRVEATSTMSDKNVDYSDDDVISVSDSVISTESMRRKVLFDSQASLDWYIFYIHVTGLALWQTFLCFDCTSRDIDIAFIAGLVMGWVFVSAKDSSALRMSCVTGYAALVCTVVLSEEHIYKSVMPEEEYLSTQGMLQLYFNICILPFCTGMFWVLAAHDTGHVIVLDARRSVITFLLISLTFPLYWSRVDISLVQNFFANLPHISIMCILILSPIFKCISIYVMLISLQKRQTLDLVLALATVLCMSSIVLYEVDTILIVRLSVAGIMLAFHFVVINCNSSFDIN